MIEEFNNYRSKMNDRIMETANTNIKRFFALDTTSYADGALDVKTKEMLGLVASMVLRCDDCIKYHLGKCYDEGVNSDEMNFTNNPTAVKPSLSGEDGKLLFDSFRYDPYAYITTVGLYNDNNDLLAVAKLSKPIQKSFNSEVSITVKLEY